MCAKKRRSRNINVLRLNPKRLFYCLIVVACLVLGTFTVHYFGNQKVKDGIESNALVVIDLVRESGVAPMELVLILDQLAQHLPFVYGNVVEPGTALDSNSLVLAGTPVAGTAYTLLQNKGYIVGYDEARKNPAWCAYKVFPPKSTETEERPPFEPDMRTRGRVTPQDYTNSGYDRGHMAPNQAIGACYGREGQKETFLMSNIVPQRHDLNAGIWKDLEQRILKRYTRSFGDVWVLCGPIYDGKNVRKIRGGVAVPTAFYLIITDREENASGALRTLAFIVPHLQPGAHYEDPRKYLTSIDEIESKTGLDFFSMLSEEIQASLESAPAKTIW